MMRLINALEASDVSGCWFRLLGTVMSFPSVNKWLNISHHFVFTFRLTETIVVWRCLRNRELDTMPTPCTKTIHTKMIFSHDLVHREGSMGQCTSMWRRWRNVVGKRIPSSNDPERLELYIIYPNIWTCKSLKRNRFVTLLANRMKKAVEDIYHQGVMDLIRTHNNVNDSKVATANERKKLSRSTSLISWK